MDTSSLEGQEQGNLKSDLVDQLRTFLFRPNLLDRAKYYAIVLLSCTPLSKKIEKKEESRSIAAVLFKVYLSFFRASVEADELPERLVSALLTGISHVAPFLSGWFKFTSYSFFLKFDLLMLR